MKTLSFQGCILNLFGSTLVSLSLARFGGLCGLNQKGLQRSVKKLKRKKKILVIFFRTEKSFII